MIEEENEGNCLGLDRCRLWILRASVVKRSTPHFMEAWLAWKVHCSTPWISRWVTFRDTPTWRTPCCWAVHKQRRNWSLPERYHANLLRQGTSFFLVQEWRQMSHFCIRHVLFCENGLTYCHKVLFGIRVSVKWWSFQKLFKTEKSIIVISIVNFNYV